jgi:CubicO group peptidase (beta-lactamase class C family)
MKFLIKLFLVFFVAQTGIAQELNTSKLDTYFKALEDNQQFMGSVALSKNGKTIYTHSSGFADVENQLKATEKTTYRIGSISKTFTAVLVMKAIEKNKLSLNQNLSGFFPQVENAEKITIEQLLRHRSGIHNFTNDKKYLTYNTEAKSQKEMLEIIAGKDSYFEPGSQFQYSNSNYVLLSYILEDVFESDYSSLLKKYIVSPINLTNTFFGETSNTEIIQSKSYKMIDNWEIQPETDASIPMGAGGIVSNPTDLIKFTQALFRGDLVKPESLKKMIDFKDRFGLGLIEMPFNEKKGFGHTGGIDGFTSVFGHFQKQGVSFAICSNGGDYNLNDILINLLSATFGKYFEIPEFKTVEVSEEELEKYLGFYTSDQIPLDLTITKKGKTLIGQGSGQPSFPLNAVGDGKFTYAAAGVAIEFEPEKNQFILKQGGGEYRFEKTER